MNANRTRPKEQKEKYKIIAMAVLLGICCVLTYYFHAILHTGTVFTHFFYVPIVLACIWWKRKGLAVAMSLAVLVIFSHIFVRVAPMTANDYLRALMFIVIGSLVAMLSEQIAKKEGAVKVAYTELNQIINTVADGMRVIDKDFNVLRANQTFSTLSGVSKDQAVGKKCYEVFTGPFCHTPSCPLTLILGGGGRVECDVEKERPDGTRIPCILTATPFRGSGGKLIGIVEDFKDITERKRAEDALAASKAYTESIIRSFLDTLIVVDTEAKIKIVNPAICHLLGYREEELIGHPVGIIFAAEEEDPILPGIRKGGSSPPPRYHPQSPTQLQNQRRATHSNVV